MRGPKPEEFLRHGREENKRGKHFALERPPDLNEWRAPLALAAARLASVNFGAKSRTAGLILTKSGALSTKSARACRFATWPDALVID